jgi:hypothetical protein
MSNQECPLKLKSTAFCKSVLTDLGTAEHSLIGLMPAIQIQMQLPKGPKLPEQIPVPFVGGLCAFALFERKPPFDQLFEADIEVRIEGLSPSTPPGNSKLIFPPGIRFSQMHIKFANPHCVFATDKEIQETEVKVKWLFGNIILGEAILPIAFTIMEQTDANKLRN